MLEDAAAVQCARLNDAETFVRRNTLALAQEVMEVDRGTQSHYGLGVLVFVELHRRILGGKFGRIPKPLSEDAFSMSGYCLDAHELIPAGSTRFRSFGPGADDWVAEPTTIERPGAKGAK